MPIIRYESTTFIKPKSLSSEEFWQIKHALKANEEISIYSKSESIFKRFKLYFIGFSIVISIMAIELLIFKKDTISLILLFLSSGFILKFILEVNSYIKFLIKKTLYLSKLKDVIIKSNSYEEYIANKN